MSQCLTLKAVNIAYSFLLLFVLAYSSNANAEANVPQELPSLTLPSLVVFKDWPVQWQGRPRDPYVAPNGDVWFCGQVTNYLARLTPTTGKMTQFDVLDGSHPHNLIVDNRGNVWYAGNKDAHIGMLMPETKQILKYEMPQGISDPHTLVFDHQGDIWFTAQHSNVIGKLHVRSGEIKAVKAHTKGSRPYGIKVDSNNQPWSVLVGTNKLATVDSTTMTLTEITLPREEARPRRLEITPDGSIWYVDYAKGYLGRYQPVSKIFTEWAMPSQDDSYPYGTALDNNGRIWIAETGQTPNTMVIFDTKTKSFISKSDISAGGTVRHMYYDNKEDAIWFGSDAGFISRASLKDHN